MKMKHPLFKKTMSAFLAVLIVALSLPFTGLIASAAEDTRLVDPSTIDGWQQFFGSKAQNITTENAGGVWLDKSVFKDLSAFSNVDGLTMDDPQNNFLVALSAIASNKSITGYSHIPTDTFLVLDVSGSMGPGNPPTYNDAVEELVTATNAAITELLALNNYNRVGVVLYSNTSMTILPLDRYTSTRTTTYNGGTKNDTSDDKVISVFFTTNNNEDKISIVSGVTNGKGTSVKTSERNVTGGTFIQCGLDQAMDEFLAVEDTTIEGTGMQSGTQRKPVIVLMSDGAPTYATTEYTNAESRNIGNGDSATAENAFLTQLTAAYTKQAVAKKYDNDVLFYTLGLGVNNNTVAEDVLDPQEYNPRAQSGIDSYWNSYFTGTGNIWVGDKTISRNSAITKDNYLYVNEYFEATKTADLYKAFESIVNEIIIQSLYYPTLAESGNYDMDGYIEFLDDLGAFMEVKSVKGVVIGNTLFSGSLLAKNFQPDGGDLGTVDNPNDMGDNMVWAVQQRLGLDNVQDARDLIQLAYDHGQLSYKSDTEFSNYIGWYGDDDGNFVSFWHDGHTAADIASAKANGATHINKSYGMLGDVRDGHRRTNMLYASIQVHTNIETGHSAVIWKIPASLIPVISYEISFDGENLDNAKNIKVSVDDADPIRLLFEVGIRSDITPLNIIEKIENTPESSANYIKNDDGTYTLFTNSFNIDELTDDDEIHPTQEINAIAWFDPSIENERYYYNENTPVFVYKNGEYVKYEGRTAPQGDTFYREYNIFEVTNKSTGAAKIEKKHEAISAQSLAQAVRNDDNTWYIPKGVIHRTLEGLAINKTENVTNTAPQSHIPDVEYTNDLYYFDAILGNNGSITVAPAQGIVISKEVDDTLANTNYTYEFTVTRTDIDNDNGEYLLTKFDANGNESGDTVGFTDSQATVTLMAGEKAYITGFPTGAKLKVSEAESTSYKTKSVNGVIGATETAEITVKANSVAEAAFVNTLKSDGNLIITKSVEHPYGADYQIPDTIKFTFNVDLGDAYKGAQITSTSGTLTDDNDDGIFVVKLSANDNITISDINSGTPVTVTEVNLPDGFAAKNNESEKSGTIEENQNTVLAFTNVYTPNKVNPVNVVVKGVKNLSGRDWMESDEFTFELQKYDGKEYVTIGSVDVTDQTAGHAFDLTNIIANEDYDAIGTYAYKIVETAGTAGGVTYDNTSYYFDIHVVDPEMDSILEIGSVTASPTTIVSQNGNTWYVDVEFNNSYDAYGTKDITINIEKTVQTVGIDDYSEAGFTFGLYNGGNLVVESQPTDQEGKTSIKLSFTEQALYDNSGATPIKLTENTFNLTLKEIVPSPAVKGMDYSKQSYNITIRIYDDMQGGIGAEIYTTGATPTGSTEYDASFINTYTAKETSVTLEATKTLTGRDLKAGEFKFDLYNANAAFTKGTVAQNDVTFVLDGKNGKITFSALTFDNEGDYYYVIVEDEADGKGVTVDKTEHKVHINVADNGEGALFAQIWVDDILDGDIIFNNAYDAADGRYTISGDKNLEGRDLVDGEFTFELYDENGELVDRQTNTDGKFTFKELVFTDIGEYIYTVKEKIGDDENVTYDTNVYTVTITVTDNGEGALEAIITKLENTAEKTDDGIVFENTYTKPVDPPTPPSVPQTGDNNNLALWLGLLFVSSSGFAGTVLYTRRKKTEN